MEKLLLSDEKKGLRKAADIEMSDSLELGPSGTRWKVGGKELKSAVSEARA